MRASLRHNLFADLYYKTIEKQLLPFVQRADVTPDQLTLLGAFVAALVPVGFWAHPVVGLLLMLTSGVADSLDGVLARRQKRCSVFGAFLDSTLDRFSDFFYLMGFWVLFWSRPHLPAATGLMFAALLFTLLISYIKARAEAIGATCDTGWMERGARVIYLTLWALTLVIFPGRIGTILWGGLWLYSALTMITVAQRIRSVRKGLLPPDPPT